MLKETPQSDNFKETLWEALERTNFDIEKQKILKKNVKKIILIIYVHLLVELVQINLRKLG